MDFPLSAVSSSSFTIIDELEIDYFNNDRLLTSSNIITALNQVPVTLFKSLKNVKDVRFNQTSLVILTDITSLSTIVTNNISISSTNLGYDGRSYFNSYFNDSDSSENSIKVNSDIINNQNVLVIPYKSSDKYSIIPLKSYTGVTNEYDYNQIKNNRISRNYTGIYLDKNNDLYTQFSICQKPIEFISDEKTSVYIPDKIQNFSINDNSFIYNGSIGGNNPLNSDLIYIDKFGYNSVTNHGNIDNTLNGELLCLWLSASDIIDPTYKWMERWYDTNTIKQGDALLADVNTISSDNSTFDKISSHVFQTKSKIIYDRFGNNRNSLFIDSASGNSIFELTKWGNILKSDVGNTAGFSVPYRPEIDMNIIDMNGSQHFHIPPNDDLFKDIITFGGWIYQDNWNCGRDTQYYGNFSNNEGYGLFFNTSATTELITIPTLSGYVYGFNNKGFRVFEKSISQSLGVSASRIDYTVTDLFGARWLYDSINYKVYKLDTDDLLKEVINLPINAEISKMEINSQNELYILNTNNKTLSGFDTNGNFILGPLFTKKYNNFTIDKNDVIAYCLADFAEVDNNGDIIKAIGINLYKNDNVFFHIGMKIESMAIDSDNNIWVVYDSNKLIKLSSDGFVIFQITIPVSFNNESSICLNFIKESKNNCDADVAWIVFNSNNYIVKVSDTGKILKRINVSDVVNLKGCQNFKLNVRGDFTGYNTKRKFNILSDSIISSINPAISVKFNIKCGNNKKIIQLHYSSKGLQGWNHLAFSYHITNNKTYIKLYINGNEVATKIIDGIYFIDYGTKISPFIIGGHSGKLGAKNIERSLNSEDYFVGKLAAFRLYDRLLNSFELRALANELFSENFVDMIWYMPIPQTTFIERIENFNINQYKGNKSNKYNIIIKNFGNISENLKSLIKMAIITNIKKISPINTELNDINFE